MEQVFSANAVEQIILSEISILEFYSTTWKKVRTKELSHDQAHGLIALFGLDLEKYHFVAVDIAILRQAKDLLSRYGGQGLRTLDSIQLATAVSMKWEIGLAKTADSLLAKLFIAEGFPV